MDTGHRTQTNNKTNQWAQDIEHRQTTKKQWAQDIKHRQTTKKHTTQKTKKI